MIINNGDHKAGYFHSREKRRGIVGPGVGPQIPMKKAFVFDQTNP